jgi:hypothetical protein
MSLADMRSAHSYNTKAEVGFSNNVLPALEDLGVVVQELDESPASGELHVKLYLPNHERQLRETVLRLLQEFEASYAYTTTVSPTIMHVEDLADE